jgi:hypothetical protein
MHIITLFFITCSGPTSMREHVWGIVCIRWSNLVAVADCDSNFIVTRVNSANVLDEGLRIGGRERRMNSKVGFDVYTRFYSYRQCWASKCRGL